jgi:arylsulfatase B
VVPPARRGAVERGWAAVDDVYPTFCALAGVDPTDARAAAAGLPPVTGHNLWPLISGANATSPRTEVYLGDTDTGAQTGNTVLQGLINASSGMKVLVGEMWWSSWPPPQSPDRNTTPAAQNVSLMCAPACLFDVINDPDERKDLAMEQPEVLAALLARRAEVEKTLFNPNRGVKNVSVFCAAATQYGGFIGPFLP